jgi:hypothetical protein
MLEAIGGDRRGPGCSNGVLCAMRSVAKELERVRCPVLGECDSNDVLTMLMASTRSNRGQDQYWAILALACASGPSNAGRWVLRMFKNFDNWGFVMVHKLDPIS